MRDLCCRDPCRDQLQGAGIDVWFRRSLGEIAGEIAGEIPGEIAGVVSYRALETHLFLKVVSFCSSSRNQYKHQFDEMLLKVDYGVWDFGDVHWLLARLTTVSLFPRLLPKP